MYCTTTRDSLTKENLSIMILSFVTFATSQATKRDCFSRKKAQRAYLMCITNNEAHSEEEQEHQEEVHQNLNMEVKKKGASNTPSTSFDDCLF